MIEAGAPTTIVALVLALNKPDVAVIVTPPAALPSVTVVLARPAAVVTEDAGVNVVPFAEAVHVTG